LALELPFNNTFRVADVPGLTIAIAKRYEDISEKTIERDPERLEEMGLVIKVYGFFLANGGALHARMVRRRGGSPRCHEVQRITLF